MLNALNTSNAEVNGLQQQLQHQQQQAAQQLQQQQQAVQQLQQQQAVQQQQQQQPLAAPLQQAQNQANNAGNADICNLLGNLTFSQIDATMPKFSGESTQNPLEFIDDFNKYCKAKNVRANSKLSTLEAALTGRASLWFNVQPNFQTFEVFIEAVKTEFHSVPVQVKVKTDWSHRRYRENEGNLQTYFYKQLRAASFIVPAL